ncbi:MAG TPA: hypothetical protein VHO06_02715 [Polyangia bacterium]|nr:hypothetical protein [Polyangia bacterium]
MNDHGAKGEGDVDTEISVLESPFGDGPHARDRARAADWLVAHADRAYPRILARIDAGRASPALVELLPRFGRAESIGRLERLLAGPELVAWAAGQALAKHPQPAAGDALRRALVGPSIPAAIVAADALGTRADRADCPALVRIARAPDVRLRYHAVEAGAKVGCFNREALQSIARTDSDAEVRGLAARLLDKRP